jgi:hypothetical protein
VSTQKGLISLAETSARMQEAEAAAAAVVPPQGELTRQATFRPVQTVAGGVESPEYDAEALVMPWSHNVMQTSFTESKTPKKMSIQVPWNATKRTMVTAGVDVRTLTKKPSFLPRLATAGSCDLGPGSPLATQESKRCRQSDAGSISFREKAREEPAAASASAASISTPGLLSQRSPSRTRNSSSNPRGSGPSSRHSPTSLLASLDASLPHPPSSPRAPGGRTRPSPSRPYAPRAQTVLLSPLSRRHSVAEVVF